MSLKYKVEIHPQKKKIISALVRGKGSLREIALQYGVTHGSLHRFLKDRLAPQIAKRRAAEQVRDGETAVNQINKVMVRVQKMYDACDEYLQDPEDPDKYYLGPRGDEIMVDYYMYDQEGKNITRFKDTLQNIINQLRGTNVTETRYKYADPRRLLLETAKVLNTQLELLARISGELKNINVSIIGTAVWIQIQQIILDATKEHPEIRRRLAGYFSSVS